MSFVQSKQQEQRVKQIRNAERQLRDIQNFELHVFLFVLLIWILFFKIIGMMEVPNDDMYPQLSAGTLLLFDRLTKKVNPQDVIVFEKNDTRYVGRVVAVGGDTVEITDDERLVINGNTIAERNIFYPTPCYEGYTEYPLTIPENSYFVLVDARQGGEDSRYFGPVEQSEIIGTVLSVLKRTPL